MKNHLSFEEFSTDALSSEELDYVEVPVSARIFFFLAGTALVVALIVLSRVIFLNIASAGFYDGRAQANANLEVAIPAHRGFITDRYGEMLAENAETFSVFVNVVNLVKDRAVFEETLQKIADTTETPYDEVYTAATSVDFERKTSVPVVRSISPETAIAVRGLALPDVRVENDFRREYFSAPAFSHVIGYTGLSTETNEVVGKTGLEQYYDSVLRGTDGARLYHRDAKGVTLDERVSAKAVDGSKLITTIDADLQQYMYDRLMSGIRALGTGAGGVAIAMEPSTGAVLSLISAPGFDSNVFVEPNRSKERVALINNAVRPLFNRAVSGAYNPGSTIKPLVALAALREQVVAPEYEIFSKGYIEIPNPFVPDKPSRFVDWKAHGWVNVRSALARSSNVYFYEIGGGFEGLKGLGIERLKQYWQQFGLGVKTGIDIGSEAVGLLPDPAYKEKATGQPWRIGDTYNVSIGQGDLLLSPVQLISFISSVANGGQLFQPRLVQEIVHPDGTSEVKKSQVLFDYSSWKDELTEVRAGMIDGVVREYGTSHLLSGLPMTSAGKTGSAQIQNNTKTNAFFVGFAPADVPQISLLILIENAKEGSLNAVPIARDILNWYYEHRLGITPRE